MIDKVKEFYVFNDDTKEKDIALIEENAKIKIENKYFGFISMVLLLVNFALGILWYRSLMGKIMICVGIVVTIFCKIFRSKFKLRTVTFMNFGIIILLTSTVLLGIADMYYNRLIFRTIDIGSKLVIGSKKEIYVGLYNRNTLPKRSEYRIESSNDDVIKIVNGEAHIIGEGAATLTVSDSFRNTLSQQFTIEEVKAHDYVVVNPQLRVGNEAPVWVSMFPSNSTDEEPVVEVVEGFEEYLKIENNAYIPLKPGVVKIRARHALGDKEFEVKIYTDFQEANIRVLDPFDTLTDSDGSVLYYLANPGDVIRLGIETIPHQVDPYSIEWTINSNEFQSQRIKDVNNIFLKFEGHMEIVLNVQNQDINGEFIFPKSITFMSKGTQ